MTKIILRLLNAPILLLIVVIGVALQTSLFNSYPFEYLQPDVVLVAVIWCALKREFTEGGILTLILADIAEIHSSSPAGLFMISYMLVYLGVRLANRLLVLPTFSSLITLTLCASVAWKLGNLAVLDMMGLSGNQWRHTLVLLLPGAVVQGVLAIWVFRWLERFDWLTFKNERARAQLEDELQLEESFGEI
jgi:hypothetical protein